MKELVEEFLANLLDMGLSRSQLSEKGYNYALALQTDQQQKGAYVTAAMMAQAAEVVKNALPGAYRMYERRHMMR